MSSDYIQDGLRLGKQPVVVALRDDDRIQVFSRKNKLLSSPSLSIDRYAPLKDARFPPVSRQKSAADARPAVIFALDYPTARDCARLCVDLCGCGSMRRGAR